MHPRNGQVSSPTIGRRASALLGDFTFTNDQVCAVLYRLTNNLLTFGLSEKNIRMMRIVETNNGVSRRETAISIRDGLFYTGSDVREQLKLLGYDEEAISNFLVL